ncbi:hypothetical protein ACGFZ9_45265 [Streptomyces mirabilis]|uniref:hypothetical protein n=1 Tax=Streptomyces mirabilis TaxID=68239 RepID=UPI00371800F5
MLSTSMLGSGWIGGATYDDNYAYVLDATSGATLLSIPFGHSVDALTMVLGEFREVSALVENLRPEATNVTSGAVAAKSAEDQIAVTGVLESGAVAAMHFRGGTSRATAFHLIPPWILRPSGRRGIGLLRSRAGKDDSPPGRIVVREQLPADSDKSMR